MNDDSALLSTATAASDTAATAWPRPLEQSLACIALGSAGWDLQGGTSAEKERNRELDRPGSQVFGETEICKVNAEAMQCLNAEVLTIKQARDVARHVYSGFFRQVKTSTQ